MPLKQQNTNTVLVDSLRSYFAGKPERWGATIFRTTDQAIADDTTVTLVFDENNNWPRSYDRALTYTTNWVTPIPFWAVANPERLTIPAPATYSMGNLAGEYIIGAHVSWEALKAGDRQLILNLVRPPAAAVIIGIQQFPAATLPTRQSITRKAWMNPGDYVYVAVRQTSGGPLDIISAAEYSPVFTIAMAR